MCDKIGPICIVAGPIFVRIYNITMRSYKSCRFSQIVGLSSEFVGFIELTLIQGATGAPQFKVAWKQHPLFA
jgi:hypothetical protein